MAYQALYRKYRPQNFDEVVGQTQIVQTLKNAVSRNRIAHAYLFSGPRGTGKTSIAKIFARTLNCTSSHPPCGECENCRLSLSGTHPDIIEIDAASNNGVDEVRKLIELVHYAPIEGKYKIYIIDEVHMMTQGAFNALLKTIEEPPAHAVFIFATTEPHKVLPTILSRCQRFDFSKVADKDIVLRLSQVCSQEGIQTDSETLEMIASLADGGMRDSLSILDQCVAYSPDHLTAETVRAIYGLVTDEDIGTIFQLLNPKTADQAIQYLTRISDQGMDMKRFLASFISLLKNSLLLDFSRETNLISEKQKEILTRSFLPASASKRIHLLEDFMETYNKISYASNILDYIETALLKNVYENHASLPISQPDTPAGWLSGSPQPLKSNHQESEKKKKNSDSSVETPKVKQKQTISEMFWKSDVSRETLTSNHSDSFFVSLNDEFLLSLMAGGHKSLRKEDEEKFKSLQIYESDMRFAKYAVSLKRASIEVSSPTFILVAVPTKMEANEINEFQKTEGYERLTKELLGSCKAIYAVENHRRKSIYQQFRSRWQEGSLPPAYSAPVKQLDEETYSKDDPLKEIQTLFDEIDIADD